MLAISYADAKDLATDAMTGHLHVDDPVYELGKALREACERIEELKGIEAKNETLEDEKFRLQAAVDEMKDEAAQFVDTLKDMTLIVPNEPEGILRTILSDIRIAARAYSKTVEGI